MNIKKLIRSSAILLSAFFALQLNAEILGSWPDGGDDTLTPSASPRKILKISSDKTEFSVQLMEDMTSKKWLQMSFRKQYKLNGGTRCRITIEMKADPEIELNSCMMRGEAPYKAIPKSWKIFRLKPEYRTFSHEFVIDKDYDLPFMTPLLTSTNGKAGTKITIRKVTFEKIMPAKVTLISKVNGNTFGPYKAKNGYTFQTLVMGEKSADEIYESEHSTNTIMTWFLRILGIVMVIGGLKGIFGFLETLLMVVPFIANILGWGVGVICTVVGVVWSLIVIAIAWLFYRPVLAIVLLAIAGVLIWIFAFKGVSPTKATVSPASTASAMERTQWKTPPFLLCITRSAA